MGVEYCECDGFDDCFNNIAFALEKGNFNENLEPDDFLELFDFIEARDLEDFLESEDAQLRMLLLLP